MADSRTQEMTDRAIDFSMGLLSPAEERSLVDEAARDPEFETILKSHCADWEKARAGRTTGVVLAAGSQPDPQTARRATRNITGRRRRLVGLVAAAAVLATVLLFRSVPDANMFWLPVDEVLSTSRSSAEAVDDWRAGVSFYADRDLDAAIQALESAQVEGASARLRDLYLTSALLNAGRETEAREVFERVGPGTLPHPWRSYSKEIELRLGIER